MQTNSKTAQRFNVRWFLKWKCCPLKAELGFRSGDIIYVLGNMDQDGFYYVSGSTAPSDLLVLYYFTFSCKRFYLDSRAICAAGEVWCRRTSCSLCRGTDGRRRPVFATNANFKKQWELSVFFIKYQPSVLFIYLFFQHQGTCFNSRLLWLVTLFHCQEAKCFLPDYLFYLLIFIERNDQKQEIKNLLK